MNVLVYGIGEFYRKNKKLLVPECYNICAFISNESEIMVEYFEGRPVISIEKIQLYKFDKIIIAEEKWIEIEQKILNIGVKLDNIIIPVINSEKCDNDIIKEKIELLKQPSKKTKLSVISYLDDKFIKVYKEYLKIKYETIFFTLNLQESRYYINEILKYSDACFFEWAGSPLIIASYSPIALTKPIITRIHRYEVYTNSLSGVNWDVVDNVIFIADHIRTKFRRKLNVSNDKLKLIHNGFEIEKYTFRNRSKGYNIAYLGTISYRKNIQLIMLIINKLKEINPNYKLYLTGKFESEEYRDYIYHIIRELNIENNVIFENYAPNINKWLDDKDYIMCSSTSEGHIATIQEAMLKGIKPIIYNYQGAEEIYPKHYLWNNLEEAVKLITEKRYESTEYRELIADGFDIAIQSEKIIKLIDNVYKNYK